MELAEILVHLEKSELFVVFYEISDFFGVSVGDLADFGLEEVAHWAGLLRISFIKIVEILAGQTAGSGDLLKGR